MNKPGKRDRRQTAMDQGTAIAGRVSITTVAALDDYARKRGLTSSQAVRRLIEAALKRRRSDSVGQSNKAPALRPAWS